MITRVLRSPSPRPLSALSALVSSALLALVASAPFARAQDDFDFAKGLAKRGYFELAEQVYKQMIDKPSADPVQKVGGQLGLASVLKVAADNEPDPAAKLRKYQQAEKAFVAVVKTLDPRHPRFFDALFDYGDLLQSKGNFIGKWIASGAADALAKKKELQGEAKQALETAGENLSKAVDHFEGKKEEDVESWQKARFYQALTFYYLAQVFDRGSFERETNLKRGAEAFENLIWDLENESQPIALYAHLYIGKCRGEMSLENNSKEDLADARGSFEGILTPLIAEQQNIDNFQDLIEQACYEQAKLLFDWKRHQDCDKAVKEVMTAIGKRPISGQWGQLALLTQAQALHQIGELARALDLAKRVAEEARGTAAGRSANTLLAELLGNGGRTEDIASVSVLLSAARGFYEGGKYLEAVRYFQQAAAKIQTPEQQKQHGASTWNWIGKSFRKLGRLQEAGLAFEEGAERYREPAELYSDNLVAAYNNLNAFANETKSDFDKAKAKEARERAAKVITGGDFAYFAAKDLFDDGRFEEAYSAFKLVEIKAGQKYDFSRGYMARSAFEAGLRYQGDKDRPDESKAREWFSRIQTDEKEYQAFITDPKNPATDPAIVSAREQSSAAFIFFRARAHKELKEPNKVIEVLAGFVERFPAQDQFVDSAMYLEVSALVDVDRLQDAEKRVIQLESKYPDSVELTKAFAVVGQVYKKVADAVEAEIEAARKASREPDPGKRSRWQANLSKAADLLYKWMRRSAAGVRPAQVLPIGEMYYKLGRFDRAEEIFGEMWERTKDDPKFPQRDSLMRLLGQTLLKRAPLSPAKYREAEPLYAELYEKHCVQPATKEKPRLVPTLMLEYAECLGGWVYADSDGKLKRADGVGKYQESLDIHSQLVTRYPEKGDEIWFDSKFGASYMLHKLNRSPEAMDIVENLENLYKEALEKSATRPLFTWLKPQLR